MRINIPTRKIRVWRRKHKKQIIFIVVLFVISLLSGFYIGIKYFGPFLVQKFPVEPEKQPQTMQIPVKIVPTTPLEAPQRPIFGKASYYSVSGCIGCRDDRLMANGEVLDDTRTTLAYNHLPLNTIVIVENTRNGKKAIAKVTDRGGFQKYNRIADLSLALAEAVDLKTDIDILTITPVK